MKACCFCMLIWVLALTGLSYAGRPLNIDDPFPVELHKFQIETGAGYAGVDSNNHFDVPLTLTYGVLPNIETQVGLGGQFDSRKDDDDETEYEQGLSDMTLSFKWNFLRHDQAFFDHGLSGTIKLPTASRRRGLGTGKVDYDLTYIIQKDLNDRASILFNLGYTWTGDREEGDVIRYGLAIIYQWTDRLAPVAELVFETPIEGELTSMGSNVGIRYAINDTLTLDAAIGKKVAGDWPDWTSTVGLTWVF